MLSDIKVFGQSLPSSKRGCRQDRIAGSGIVPESGSAHEPGGALTTFVWDGSDYLQERS
jgi:hypothetical protein